MAFRRTSGGAEDRDAASCPSPPRSSRGRTRPRRGLASRLRPRRGPRRGAGHRPPPAPARASLPAPRPRRGVLHAPAGELGVEPGQRLRAPRTGRHRQVGGAVAVEVAGHERRPELCDPRSACCSKTRSSVGCTSDRAGAGAARGARETSAPAESGSDDRLLLLGHAGARARPHRQVQRAARRRQAPARRARSSGSACCGPRSTRRGGPCDPPRRATETSYGRLRLERQQERDHPVLVAAAQLVERVPRAPRPGCRGARSRSAGRSVRLSCMNRPRARRPHSGAVRILFRVEAPPFWTMPSPVPTSCSRKSLNGWMILLPSALATRKAPPLIRVPGSAVTMVRVWHVAQPIALKMLAARPRIRARRTARRPRAAPWSSA